MARGLRRITCRSTHFNMVSTESVNIENFLGQIGMEQKFRQKLLPVDGKRCSADVLTICEDVTRNVAAIPFKACNEIFIIFNSTKFFLIFQFEFIPA